MMGSERVAVDPNSLGDIVAVTELREQLASLQKQLAAKDKQLLSKEKQVGHVGNGGFGLSDAYRLHDDHVEAALAGALQPGQVMRPGCGHHRVERAADRRQGDQQGHRRMAAELRGWAEMLR